MHKNQNEFLVPYYDGDINEHLSMPEGFQNRLIDNEPLDYIFEDHNSDLLVISFGGCGYDENNEAIYSFVKFLSDKPFSKLLFRDHFNVWYFNGIRGLSKDIESTRDAIKDLINKIPHKKTIFVGNSGGGFAALLFGVLLCANKIIAINPQTLLQKGVECFAHGNLYKLKWCNQDETKYYDLLNVDQINKDQYIEIVYGKDDIIDQFHSGRMKDWNNVHLLPVDGTHATVAITIRDNGNLGKLIFNV